MPSFRDMEQGYKTKWAACKINPSWQGEADAWVKTIWTNKQRYEAAQRQSGIWWPVIACIHALESSASFRGHLHNGDPLTKRTVQVPAGRPLGTPPFTWEESAADALGMKRSVLEALGGSLNTVEECLYFLENYNGWGYQEGAGRASTPSKSSPYLWSGTNQWIRGKYVADGRFDANAGSSQFGAAGMLKALVSQGLISFELVAVPKAASAPYAPAPVPFPWLEKDKTFIRFGEKSEKVRWVISAFMGLGYLAKDDNTTDVFNATLQDAVIYFQTKRKIEVDGVVGPYTITEIEQQLIAARGKPNPPKKPEADFSKVTIEKGAPSMARPNWPGLVPILVTLGDKTFTCASGQSWAQDFDLPNDPGSVPGNMEPIPEGEYRLGDIDWSFGKDVIRLDSGGIGGPFIPIVAKFADDRGAFGFHLDANISRSPGSAGCVVFYSIAELKEFIELLRKYDPRDCTVDWGIA